MSLRELLSRASLLVLVALIAAMLVFSRWLALGALGEELELLKELELGNAMVGGMLLAAFCALPAKRANLVLRADRSLLTRHVSPLQLTLGRFLASSTLMTLAFVLWVAATWLALVLLENAEPVIFQWNRPAESTSELISMLPWFVLVWVQSLVLLSLAMVAGSRGSLASALTAALALLVLGSLIPGVVPNMNLYALGVIDTTSLADWLAVLAQSLGAVTVLLFIASRLNLSLSRHDTA